MIDNSKQLIKENRELRRYLRELTKAVDSHIDYMDRIMTEPSSKERDKWIAMYINGLNLKNDSAKHFGLGIPISKL